jgi:CIC family chloride channel protein
MAAGVAGAYNTPIAATLFVVEVVVGSFSMSLFGPAVVSAVVSTLLVRAVLGDEPVYQVAPFSVESLFEFSPVHGHRRSRRSLLELCSFRALALGKKLFSASKLRSGPAMSLGGAIVGAIAVFMPECLGNGFEATDRDPARQSDDPLPARPRRREDGRHGLDHRLGRRRRRLHAFAAGGRDRWAA